MNDINIAAAQAHDKIIRLLQQCNLPISLAYYVLTDVYNIVSKEYERYISEKTLMMTQQQIQQSSIQQNNKDQEEE